MAESRIALSYVQLAPLLTKDFAKELQKAINNALKGINFSALGDGLRDEGRQAGRDFRRGLESGIGNNGVDLNFRDTIQEAGQAGRRSGFDFRQAMDSSIGNYSPDLNTESTIQESGGDGRKAGKSYIDNFHAAVQAAGLNLPAGVSPAASAQAGAASGQSFGQAWAAQFQQATSGAMDNLVGAVGMGAIAGVTGAGIGLAAKYDAGSKEIAASLAVTSKEEKDKITEAIRQIFTSGTVESYEDAEIAVESVLSSNPALLQGSTAEIVKMSKRLAELNKAFEVEMPTAMAVAGQMVKQGFVKDVDEGLTLLFASMGKMSLQTRHEIVENMNEYSKHFQGLGFSAKAAFSLIVSASQEGGNMGMDQTADAVKEMGILLGNTENKGTGEALAAIGLNHGEIAEDIIAGGSRADAAIESVALGLLGVEDASERARLAVSIMGTPFEDLSYSNMDEVLTDLATVNDNLGDTTAIADRASKIMDESFAASMIKLKHEAMMTFAEVFIPLLEQLIPHLINFLEWIRENKDAIQAWIPIILAVGFAISAIIASGILVALGTLFSAVAVPAGALLAVVTLIAAALIGLPKWFEDWDGISKGLEVISINLGHFFDDLFSNIINGLLLLPKIAVFVVSNIVIAFTNGLAVVANGFIGLWNLIASIPIPDWMGGGTWGKQISYLDIAADWLQWGSLPQMATGGDVMGPTALIAGEKEPETIVNRGATNRMIEGINARLDSDARGVQAAPQIIINQLPGQSQEELAALVVERLAWESGRS